MTRMFVFQTDATLVAFEGSYTDYMKKYGSIPGSVSIDKPTNTKNEDSDSKSTWTHEKKVKFTYKEQQEWDGIEEEIDNLEERLEEIDGEMVKNASDFGKLNDLQKEKEEKEKLLEEKMERWEYLSEIYDQMQKR